MHAVHYNRIDAANTLLRYGADVNHQDPVDKATALHEAAFRGSNMMVYECVCVRHIG